VTAYTNHGNASPAERNSGWKPKLSERDRHTLKRIVSKNHRTTAAKVTAELSIYHEDCFHRNSSKRASWIHHPWKNCNCYTSDYWKTMLKGQKGGVMITKPGRPMHGNT
jgi:hypothetical protein